MSVLVETTLGTIVIDLFVKERPKTSMNFLKLCKMKYYNFCVFHAIEENYIAQSGDPDGSGKGGMSLSGLLYGEQARYMEGEDNPKIKHTRKGLLSMVHNTDGLIGSQFFLTLDDGLDYLDGKHTVIGQMAEGWDVLEKLNETTVDEENRPYQDVRLLHTILLDDPFPDPAGFQPPSRSPSPDAALLRSARIGVDEAVDELEGAPEEEVVEYLEAKEATARANILTMIGDLHEADELPPDNVLFVCKLNAVTTDEDLEIIFSRFGSIKKCEIIKDRKSGASLQYAFIEYHEPKHCENAFFKMDNVLIDDRRIHVDFSQSVSKNSSWFDKFNRDMGGGPRKAPPPSERRPKTESGAARRDPEPRDDRQLKRREDERRRRHQEKDRRGSRRDDDRRRRSPSPSRHRRHNKSSHRSRQRSRS